MKRNIKKFIKIFTLIFILSSVLSLSTDTGVMAEKARDPKTIRIGGSDRVATSTKVSQEAFKDGAETVILVGSRGEIDALGGTLLASKLGAPIIMTNKNTLSTAARDEIERLKPKNIVILGGNNAVSQNVRNSLNGYNVRRIDGSNREETAVNIAKEAVEGEINEVFIALGYDVYADALAIGPVTAKKNKPLLLTSKNGLADETIKAIQNFGVEKVTIVGGNSAVSKNIENNLNSMGIETGRVEGSNREKTSINIAKKYFDNPEGIIVANGYVFADSVVGGYYSNKINAPILLTRHNKLLDSTFNYIKKTKKDTIILGKSEAISKSVEENLNKALRGEESQEPDKPETVSQRNAIRKAKDYLEYSSFSREGLIGQLEYEGFSKRDSIYAVDKLNINWREQAVKKAKDYLEYSSFSREGLVEQLEYEGFSKSDSIYAVDELNVNWNEQAVKKAKDYLEYSSFSREGLIEQLEYEGFSNSQAVYAVDKIGL